jgi:hypothetical protein
VIATYELNYKKGKETALGIYSDDIIANHRFNEHFDSLKLAWNSSVISISKFSFGYEDLLRLNDMVEKRRAAINV